MEVQSVCLAAPAVTSPVLALCHHHHSRAVPCRAMLRSCVVPCSPMPCHTVPGCASPRHALLAGGEEVPVTGGLVSLLSSMGWVTPEHSRATKQVPMGAIAVGSCYGILPCRKDLAWCWEMQHLGGDSHILIVSPPLQGVCCRNTCGSGSRGTGGTMQHGDTPLHPSQCPQPQPTAHSQPGLGTGVTELGRGGACRVTKHSACFLPLLMCCFHFRVLGQAILALARSPCAVRPHGQVGGGWRDEGPTASCGLGVAEGGLGSWGQGLQVGARLGCGMAWGCCGGGEGPHAMYPSLGLGSPVCVVAVAL